MIEKLMPFINGKFVESKSERYMDVFDPSVGEMIAQIPCCTKEEVEAAIAAARRAFPAWANTPCAKRVEILYRFRDLLMENIVDLTYVLCRENGKNWEEKSGLLQNLRQRKAWKHSQVT